MYINNREEVNYHEFMTGLRNMHGYTLDKVRMGVCSESALDRFEKGNRVAEKLMRDRLVARLGVSCERYEDYLLPKEYMQWKQRMQIVQAIESGKIDAARKKLKEYEKIRKRNGINKQFVEAMHYMLLTMEGAAEELRYDSIKRAVRFTVLNYKKALNGECLLADQEINLMLEQLSLEKPKEKVLDEGAWRISQYEKLLHYIETSCWEKLQKAKVYPKVVCYIGFQLLKQELLEDEIRQGIKRCQDAIDLLRETGCFYYLMELTEIGLDLAKRLKEVADSDEKWDELEHWIDQNESRKATLAALGAEYQVDIRMSNFCYFYHENECHNIVEVLEGRRKLLGLSRKKLANGICSLKTIIRFEREGVGPSLELARCLFEKMGLCAEYRRSCVITTDVKVLQISDEVVRNIDSGFFEEGELNLMRLKDRISMDISHNKQQVLRWETSLDWKRQALEKEEVFERTKRALEYTLPIEALGKGRDMFLSRSEWMLVYDLAFKTTGELQAPSVQMIENYYVSKMGSGHESGCICILEHFGSGLVRFYREMGEYERSNQMEKALIKACLINKRSGVFSELLYNKIWHIC